MPMPMPYIITITLERRDASRVQTKTATAVATLNRTLRDAVDEAVRHVHLALGADALPGTPASVPTEPTATLDYSKPVAERRNYSAEAVCPTGRSLLVGTLIEVRRVTRTELAELVGINIDSEFIPSVVDLVAAYNAKEQS